MSNAGYFKGATAAGNLGSVGAGYACDAEAPRATNIAVNKISPVAGPIGLERQTVQLFEELERLDKEVQALCAHLYPLTYDQKTEHIANDCVPLQPGNSPVGQSIYEGTLKVGMARKVLYNLRNSLEI